MRVRTGGKSEACATIAVDAVLNDLEALGVASAKNPSSLAGAAD